MRYEWHELHVFSLVIRIEFLVLRYGAVCTII